MAISDRLGLGILQVTGTEAPELDVDEKNFLPSEPKNAEEADETESW